MGYHNYTAEFKVFLTLHKNIINVGEKNLKVAISTGFILASLIYNLLLIKKPLMVLK